MKLFPFLLTICALISVNYPAKAAHVDTPIGVSTNFTNSSTLELKQLSLDKSFQTASVCFLGVGDCQTGDYGIGDDDMDVDTEKQCMNESFIKYNCNSVQEPEDFCPYDNRYITKCICKSTLITCPAGQVGVGEACNGKYASCQCSPSLVTCDTKQNGGGASCNGKYEYCTCKPEYQYNTSNCSSPQYLSGSSCGGKYNNCSCPSPQSCPNGCATYYSSPCGSVCAQCATNPDCDAIPQDCYHGCSSTNSCGICTSCGGDPDCDVVSKNCPYGCSATNGCDKCISCDGNSDCDVPSKNCPNGCANTNSCKKCTACKGNPDCDVTSKTCPYGCATKNSCDKCTSCKSNPDCDVTSKTCSNGCATKNSCDKCTSCKSCTPTCTNESDCEYGTTTASDSCGGTCTRCLPACTGSYEYGYQSSDCFIAPAKHLYQPNNRNCGKCVCDNVNTSCNGRPCACRIL